ncbi:NO-inducible flavohemoprotein [Paludibacterium purpuratum]|uniref:Flavohemoprotein n=1 Tax=Paludibacterium purpuratum TaxID=1144873 RepID=A0A4R7B8L3_9NEIS|nr:NO-inducible flavohemoprotein [Paludibacterium purpuratum]TDR80076.1 nitric oxide dioxygenase [Paludibacterium purpuratum]
MLDATTCALVKATVPVLREHGVALTSHFYQRMFRHNPALKHIFNQSHQQAGQQQQSLALAVLGYAENIEDPSVLAPVLTRIANKHASLGIRAEHYPIVGQHLLASIREVLGDAANDALIDAWASAYGQLADMLVAEENRLYSEAALAEGGWSGWRPFKVERKAAESEEITSFYLRPADEGKVPLFRPGQYISVSHFISDLNLAQPRQYSLSDAPNGEYLRISVKREDAHENTPAGQVSGLLHRHLQEGDIINVSPPFGDFFLHEERQTPVVLISAGVGQTPMQSMLQHLANTASRRTIRFLHAARHGGVHAMNAHTRQLAEQHDNLKVAVYYETPRPQDRPGVDYDRAGRMDLAQLNADMLPENGDYYLCGPVAFMLAQRDSLLARGIDCARIHYEVFGSNAIAG